MTFQPPGNLPPVCSPHRHQNHLSKMHIFFMFALWVEMSAVFHCQKCHLYLETRPASMVTSWFSFYTSDCSHLQPLAVSQSYHFRTPPFSVDLSICFKHSSCHQPFDIFYVSSNSHVNNSLRNIPWMTQILVFLLYVPFMLYNGHFIMSTKLIDCEQYACLIIQSL